MSENPFKIGDFVDGSFEVDEPTTFVLPGVKLNWRQDDHPPTLTLDEIYEQAEKQLSHNGRTIFLRVHYESGLWGVIFEIGSYLELGKQWIVHGITKGYA